MFNLETHFLGKFSSLPATACFQQKKSDVFRLVRICFTVFRSENKPSSGATSVEELKRRLGTLYGSSYTPTYTPTSTRSQQPTNQNIASTSNSTSASSFITSYNSNSASSYGGSANSSGYINQGFSSNYTSSGSSWDTQFESKPKTQFADPFAAFNRAEEPSSTYTENSNSGAQVAKNHSGFPTR